MTETDMKSDDIKIDGFVFVRNNALKIAKSNGLSISITCFLFLAYISFSTILIFHD